MLYFRKYLTNSQKTFFGWKDDEGGYCELQIFQHPENENFRGLAVLVL